MLRTAGGRLLQRRALPGSLAEALEGLRFGNAGSEALRATSSSAAAEERTGHAPPAAAASATSVTVVAEQPATPDRVAKVIAHSFHK